VSVPGALTLAQGELGLRLGERGKRALPVALQAAGDQPVLGLDLAVAPFGPLGLVASTLDLQPPSRQRLIVVLLERLGRLQRGLIITSAGVSACSSAPPTTSSIRTPPTGTHH
jgi:hypothetical protein